MRGVPRERARSPARPVVERHLEEPAERVTMRVSFSGV
jgi:hypothetical protein